ncbi:MAG: two-component regulator propeller domain-containing protein [Bacteroidota bacterium]|nr:two-component regulator propeller domain-containing protein [Bacteroidota bacterium]
MGQGKLGKLLFYLISVLISANSFGQSGNIEFDQYTTNEGLSNGYINAFLHDSKGFIWIGTANGLNRFDGINFKTYYSEIKDSTTLPGSGVTALVEDSLGNIWVMTSNGFCVYNRKKDSFSRKTMRVSEVIINNSFQYSCFIDSKGFLWASSPIVGIFRFKIFDNPQISNAIIDADLYLLEEDDVDSKLRNNVYSFVEDENNQIWVASQSNTLYYFDNQQNKFIPKQIDHPEVDNFSNRRKGLFKDSGGDFFISIEDNGLLVWDRGKNDFRLYKPNGTNTGPKGRVLSALAEDRDGLIWIGDRNAEGISIFNKKTGKFSYCRSDKSDPYSLNTNKINCIYQDKTGSMWVGAIIGVNKYSPGKLKFKRYFSNPNIPGKLSNNNTLSFAESKTGEIWIGTDGGGLNKFDRKTGVFSHFKDNPSDPNSLSSNAVISICEDHEGTLWMGTYHGGLARMKNGKFDALYPDPANPHSVSDRNIWYVFEDSKNNLWVGTLNSGLDLFDRKTGRFYPYTSAEGDSTSLCNNSIRQIYEDSKQNLYITGNQGVSIIDLKAYDFSGPPPDIKFRNLVHRENSNSLISNDVYCVKEDKEGNLWFGTYGSGIDKLELATGKYTNYSTKDGFPGNSVTSILVDDLNNLWLATDKGLVKFNPDTKEVVVFDQKDGLQNTSLKSWAIKTKDGEMLFGGPDGFNSFYPDRIINNQNQNKPPVVITGLKIFNKPVEINEQFNGRVLLENDISETRELVITYRENYFTFDFIALDYLAPEKNSYAYMMEGFDVEWVQCGARREANYTNLDPGEYTFRVKASNNNGVWNEEGTSIKITILPPWWRTWWFRTIAILSIILIIGSGFYSRLRYFGNQKIMLEKLVAQKTSDLQKMNAILTNQAEELNKTNSLLEERQEQVEEQSVELLAQKESLIKVNIELHDLNATKDKFFSIIAHDIKNPFNAVLGFTDLLEENFKEWDDERKLEVVNLINASAKNLYELLENLLQWSRSQSGVIEFKPQEILLKDTFSNAIGLFKETAHAKNIELGFTLADTEMVVYADKNMLDAIMRNLISNAIKFTNTEGKVHVFAEANEEFAVVKVTDNGVGISPEIQRQLFRIDKQTSTYGTNNESGTGLGLILVKEFVTKQGGTIGVESIKGKGSTFYFSLPLMNGN